MRVDLKTVEFEMTKIVQEITSVLQLETDINSDTCPNKVGISSQILVSATTRLEEALKVSIPAECYIFHDKKSKKHLTIREASQKLIKIVNNGKK
jgi:acyl carrier protein